MRHAQIVYRRFDPALSLLVETDLTRFHVHTCMLEQDFD